MGINRSKLAPLETVCSQPNFDLNLLACSNEFLAVRGMKEEWDVLTPPIGQSHFCEVREMVNRLTGDSCVLKVFNCTLLSSRERDFLVRHFQFLREKSHPNILKVYDVYDDKPDFVAVLLEDFQGSSVADFMVQNGTRLSSFMVCRIIAQVASVIAFLHAQKIDCGNLNPHQLLFNGSIVKLYNFEFSLKHSGDPGIEKHQLISVFSAPEFLLFGKKSAKSDVWALGVLSYYLFTGFMPFLADEETKTLENIAVNKPRMPIDHLLISEDEQTLLFQMLASDPSNRISLDKIRTTKFMSDHHNAYLNTLGKILQMMKECLQDEAPANQLEASFRIIYVCWTKETPIWFNDVITVFLHIDRRGVGLVNRQDIVEATEAPSLQPFRDLLLQLFRQWSFENDFVPLEVFLAALLRPFTQDIPKNSDAFIRSFPLDDDGSIPKQALEGRTATVHPFVRRFVHFPDYDFCVAPRDIPLYLFGI